MKLKTRAFKKRKEKVSQKYILKDTNDYRAGSEASRKLIGTELDYNLRI